MGSTKGTTMERNSTCVFVDWCELVIALQKLHKHARIDFVRLKSWIKSRWPSSDVRYYTSDIPTDKDRRAGFYTFLRRAGYEVVTCKNPYNHLASSANEEKVRAACHCAMVWDMCSFSHHGRYDSFVLLSGAGQFEQVADWVKGHGITFDVAFFERLCSDLLLQKANRFVEFNISAVTMLKPCQNGRVRPDRDRAYA